MHGFIFQLIILGGCFLYFLRYKPSNLQIKLQKQRERARKTRPLNGSPNVVITNAPKKTSLLSATRYDCRSISFDI